MNKVSISIGSIERVKDIRDRAQALGRLPVWAPVARLVQELAHVHLEHLEQTEPGRVAKAIVEGLVNLNDPRNQVMGTPLQLDQAATAVRRIRAILGPAELELEGAIVQLRDAVGKAQNGPPDGESDGSISEPRWLHLNALLNDAEQALLAVQRIQASAEG